MTPTDTGIPDITFIDLTSYVGLTATGLLTINLLLGLLLSTRYNPVANWPHRRLPLYDLHNWTGYVALPWPWCWSIRCCCCSPPRPSSAGSTWV